MASEFVVNIQLQDNSKEIEKELEKDMERCLYAMGVLAVEGAVTAISSGETQAVDTGRLRASISFVTAGGQKGTSGQGSTESKSGDELSGKAQKESVIVGSNVEYAVYVHDGTSKMSGRPFLRVGIDNKRNEMKEIVEGILKGEY